ncbi:plasmid partitioning/stability family protein [Serratia fonticola]|uniref:Plasmid partitioning/stability family protein n=1 Tax=Serratia fonticola TaxID=47917 RepID=A0AAW3WJM6_SERFO|nr:plasmid partitioning/stability family protein [Serratia fonticola]MBC3211038.1 plasmid partitioning/stability family protein [Serratia fonticola]NYA12020.1 plasmid partitioning/stability family protein [Serratia fonticola]NYA31599.1 plasmid partitioning/stability family protein [Serratia fonticola]
MMDNKRKKIISYLHPSIYPQDRLAQHYVERLPVQVRGDFYRQAIICGVALSSIDPRLVNLISGFFTESITAEDVIKLVAQVTAFPVSRFDVNNVRSDIIENSSGSHINTVPEIKKVEKTAIENLSKLKI